MELADVEEWVLLAIVALKERAYGVSIHDTLRRAGIRTSLGAIYTGLDRLEERRLVKSDLGEATPMRGGRRKRLFRATASGRRALAERQAIRNRILAWKEGTT
jgi:PadR family transcriptional regulator PadR